MPDKKLQILIVDDESSITSSLTRLLRREGFHPISAASGPEGLELLEKTEDPVALIISDQRMPDMTGDQFLEKAKNLAPQAMRFLLTGYADMEALINALNRGQVHRYIAKPWNDEDLVMQVRQAVEHFEIIKENEDLVQLTQHQNKELAKLNRQLEQKVAQRSRVLLKAHEELKFNLMNGFRLILSVVEMLNPSLGGYLTHVGELSKAVARKMKLDQDAQDQIELAGMFHDIGLMGMPDTLLSKDKVDMDADEHSLYIQHPLLMAICFESNPQLIEASKIILSHHENYDGSGYPNGLEENMIPIGGRIIAAVSDYCRIIDTWPADPVEIRAKVAKRYTDELLEQLQEKEPEDLLNEVAVAVMLDGAGSRYDPTVIETLEAVLADLKAAPSRQTSMTIDELESGMVLAESVLMDDNQPIMSKGIRLNQRLIESLEKLHRHGRIGDKVSVDLSKK